LLEMMFGWKTNPHAGPFHIVSFVLIGGGFLLIATGWKILYEAQRQHRLATSGVYAHLRHPQYVRFILVMLGFLLQWPTLLALAMFRVLVFMYVRLARGEEVDALAEFGPDYKRYVHDVPAFLPRFADIAGWFSLPRRR